MKSVKDKEFLLEVMMSPAVNGRYLWAVYRSFVWDFFSLTLFFIDDNVSHLTLAFDSLVQIGEGSFDIRYSCWKIKRLVLSLDI